MKQTDLLRRQHASVGYLLIRAGQLWNELAIARVNALAGAPVLRESHTRLLPLLLRPNGARVVDLARRLGLTKQAVQPLVAELKALGVVTTKPDREDGRASRVVLTARGLKGINSGNDVLREIESELAEAFGKGDMKVLRGMLRRLLSQLEDQGERIDGNPLCSRPSHTHRERGLLHGRRRAEPGAPATNDGIRLAER